MVVSSAGCFRADKLAVRFFLLASLESSYFRIRQSFQTGDRVVMPHGLFSNMGTRDNAGDDDAAISVKPKQHNVDA